MAAPQSRRTGRSEKAEVPSEEQASDEAADAADEEGPSPSHRQSTPLLKPDPKRSRVPEMQRAIIVIAALVFLGMTFYVGTKYQYLKYLILTRGGNEPKLENPVVDKYPDASADELVAQALAAERAGDYKGAVERFMAAKHKNLGYRGILFRGGMVAYEKGDYEVADKLFERAIAFGENLDAANHYRGLVSTRRRDFPAAERFFAAAIEAAPFVREHHHYLAETIRLSYRPLEAIRHYERAALLAQTEHDAAVFGFKIRMARIEGAEMPKIAEEIATREAEGSLSVDWMMTAAALHIRQGNIGEGLRYLTKARNGGSPGLFLSCLSDASFRNACQVHSLLKQACQATFDTNAVATGEQGL